MPLDKYLGILGACVGLLSALFFAFGTLRLRYKDIVGIAGTYWDFNLHLADSIASQRAEYIVGALLLLLSFSLQLAANLVPPDIGPSFLQQFDAAVLAILLAVSATAFLSWLLVASVSARTQQKVRKLLQSKTEDEAKS